MEERDIHDQAALNLAVGEDSQIRAGTLPPDLFWSPRVGLERGAASEAPSKSGAPPCQLVHRH